MKSQFEKMRVNYKETLWPMVHECLDEIAQLEAEIERLREELDAERRGKTYRSECAGCLAVMPELERLRAAIRAAIGFSAPAETMPECPDCNSTDLIRIQAVHPDLKILVPVYHCRCGVEVTGGDAEDVINAHLKANPPAATEEGQR